MREAGLQGSNVTFRNLTLGYDGHPAVHHLDGAIAAGSLTAIVGPNGAGKSTLLKAIAGLIKPLEGRVLVDPTARSRAKRAASVAYLPQQAGIDRHFPVSVEDLVSLGLWSKVGSWRGISAQNRSEVRAAIRAVGLEGFEARPIDKLSGGQLQRVMFARVLVQDSALILLDEPFNAIDAKTAADLMALILNWHAEKRTVVAVLHDIELVRSRFPETLLLAREVIAWGMSDNVLTPANLDRARSMAEAFDEAAPVCHGTHAA